MIPKELGNVAIIDAGGRGHVLAEAYAPQADSITLLPGNDFAKRDIEDRFGIPVTTNTDLPKDLQTNLKQPETFHRALEGGHFGIVDVAQDDALAGNVAGWSRQFFPTVGHDGATSRIESSKSFARDLNKRAGIPQPEYEVFTSAEDALAFLRSHQDIARFIKADGLAEGKAALPANDLYEAEKAIEELVAKYPKAASKIVVEEWMRNADGTPGSEYSNFRAAVNKDQIDLGYAVDHKRIGNFDTGENTGSMGSNSPTNLATEELRRLNDERIVGPLMEQMEREGLKPQGIIYISGMATYDHEGRMRVDVIEYNSRWGDPEVQVIVPGIRNYPEIAQGIAAGDINGIQPDFDGKHRVVVTGAARGYPVDYSSVKGKEIYGLDEAQQVEGVRIYGAGVAFDVNGVPRVAGGRNIYSRGEGTSIHQARERALAAMSHVTIAGNNLDYRNDIGYGDVLRDRATLA